MKDGKEKKREDIMEKNQRNKKKKIERKKRKERRKNFIIKKIKVTQEKRKMVLDEISTDMTGMKAKIEEVQKIKGNIEEETEWMWMKNKKQQRDIWKKKKNLKGRKERIMEDLT